MNITLKKVKGIQIVKLKGELDLASVDILTEGVEVLLSKSIKEGIIFDMSELSLIDSSGIGALIYICNQLITSSTPFYLVDITTDVEDVFSILGLSMAIGEEHFNYRTAEEALSDLLIAN
jgi:anti-anti-sigma factor